MLKSLKTNHGRITLPTFFPDATRAVVKGGVDSLDLQQAQVAGLVVNTLHLGELLLKDPTRSVDIHQFMNWPKPLITDSGGFQVMSLIHKSPKLGYLTDDEAVFLNDQQEKIIFTPEKSIQMQLRLGADILICLDDCTHPQAPLAEQEKSVERTISWAKRCKVEFDKLTKDQINKPLLFAVVQGGNSIDLRAECAKTLISLDFDGYCYGGFPVDEQNNFLTEIVQLVANLLPSDKPKYAMGVGRPQDIVACFGMGYNMFDCVIPTREARHQRLYEFTKSVDQLNLNEQFFQTFTITKAPYKNDQQPVSANCDCLTCTNYSRAYLYHLFKMKDLLAYRLATIHNLRFYTKLLELLKIQNTEK